jgi:hypothetical protein
MSDDRPTPAYDRDEALLERLRELARERDPVPDHVMAAARSALAARERVDTKPPGGG